VRRNGPDHCPSATRHPPSFFICVLDTREPVGVRVYVPQQFSPDETTADFGRFTESVCWTPERRGLGLALVTALGASRFADCGYESLASFANDHPNVRGCYSKSWMDNPYCMISNMCLDRIVLRSEYTF